MALKPANLPAEPGVYLLYDESGTLIYVGKAASLKDRLSFYFQKGVPPHPRLESLLKSIGRVDYIITDNEVEALVLETHLIKKHKPRFNVRLKDDKRYPLLEITMGEMIPRVKTARKAVNPESRYFGPYPDAGKMRLTLKLMRKTFGIAACKGKISNRTRPCLDYQLGQCSAPCTGEISIEEYRERINRAVRLLEGRLNELIGDLRKRLETESAALNFEECARIKKQLDALTRLNEDQKVFSSEGGDADYLALVEDPEGESVVEMLRLREGKLSGYSHFRLTFPPETTHEEKLSSFLKLYYQPGISPPGRIYLPFPVPETGLLSDMLSRYAGKKVRLIHPGRGKHRELVELARKNALSHMASRKTDRSAAALSMLAQVLNLPGPPGRIEAYDISHLGGGEPVGSMVVFTGGKPANDQYRVFNLGLEGTRDDPAMMGETVSRRMAHKEWEMPDLILLDGGKTQLAAVVRALGKSDIPIVSLAKEHELIYSPGRRNAYRLDHDNPALQLLMRIRDEAHRFAIKTQRNRRKKSRLTTSLLEIPGIGGTRANRLLSAFGSVENIKNASVEQIASAGGFGEELASEISRALQ
ncbi:MAG: excinuclease ABC subunit UvrC [Chloroflexi bacterium]|nr:excinuclease ABC subunit UvrC [Chloroflexota bacterium]